MFRQGVSTVQGREKKVNKCFLEEQGILLAMRAVPFKKTQIRIEKVDSPYFFWTIMRTLIPNFTIGHFIYIIIYVY